MKKLVATGALMALTTMFAMAQDAQKGGAANTQGTPLKTATPNPAIPRPAPMSAADREKTMAEHQTKFMVTRFKLDEDQSKKIQEANLNFMKGMDELRTSGKIADAKEREKLEISRDAAFKKIMNEEQFKLYESSKRRPMMAPNQNAGGGKPVNAVNPTTPTPDSKK